MHTPSHSINQPNPVRTSLGGPSSPPLQFCREKSRLGQSFYGWYSAPCPPLVLFGARPPLAAERGLGRGHSGPPLAGRPPENYTPGHVTLKFLSYSFHVTYHSQTISNPVTPPYSGIGASAPTKGTIIMKTTRAQIRANRKNAKKSTGPRTEDGNARVAKNALKHGLLARDTVLPGEDPTEFDRQLSALEADIQPANSLEFELVRQIADSQWRMRRLTRLETGFLAAALDETSRYMEKRRPDELRPGYDGETLLLGSAMLDRTQAFVHLARYDGHLSRRFFRAVKQLADLRRDERKAQEARSSSPSYTSADPDPYRGRYVPAQAPPTIDTPSPAAARIGFRGGRASAPQTTLPQTTKQTQSRRTPVKSAVAHAFLRAVSPLVATLLWGEPLR